MGLSMAIAERLRNAEPERDALIRARTRAVVARLPSAIQAQVHALVTRLDVALRIEDALVSSHVAQVGVGGDECGGDAAVVFIFDRARHHGPTSTRKHIVKPESAGTTGIVVLHRRYSDFAPLTRKFDGFKNDAHVVQEAGHPWPFGCER